MVHFLLLRRRKEKVIHVLTTFLDRYTYAITVSRVTIVTDTLWLTWTLRVVRYYWAGYRETNVRARKWRAKNFWTPYKSFIVRTRRCCKKHKGGHLMTSLFDLRSLIQSFN